MKLIMAYILYFLLCMISFRGIHLVLQRYDLDGLVRDGVFFGFGFLAWFILRYLLVAQELGREMARLWPVGFVVAVAALMVYDWLQVNYDQGD